MAHFDILGYFVKSLCIFGAPFTGLTSVVMPQNWQIYGMSTGSTEECTNKRKICATGNVWSGAWCSPGNLLLKELFLRVTFITESLLQKYNRKENFGNCKSNFPKAKYLMQFFFEPILSNTIFKDDQHRQDLVFKA